MKNTFMFRLKHSMCADKSACPAKLNQYNIILVLYSGNLGSGMDQNVVVTGRTSLVIPTKCNVSGEFDSRATASLSHIPNP